MPVGALDLGATGVYQLGVTLDGQSAAEPWEHVLGIKRTFLPWYDDGETAKTTKISYLWPLTDRPHIAPRGDTDSQQSPIFLDDDLTQELAPGGRLQEMVQLGQEPPRHLGHRPRPARLGRGDDEELPGGSTTTATSP